MELGEKARMFTNVYVKNINEEYDEARLNDMFEKYGKISSVKVFFITCFYKFTEYYSIMISELDVLRYDWQICTAIEFELLFELMLRVGFFFLCSILQKIATSFHI